MWMEEYCRQKKLPQKLLLSLGWHENPHGLTIPYYDVNGELVGEAIRVMRPGPGPRFLWPAGKKRIPYLLWRLKENPRLLWVTEGETDAVTLLYLLGGEANVVGIPGASSSLELLQSLPQAAQTVILPHSDDAGRALVDRLRTVRPCWVITMPANDLNDWYLQVGADAIVEALERAWQPSQPISAIYVDGSWPRQPLPKQLTPSRTMAPKAVAERAGKRPAIHPRITIDDVFRILGRRGPLRKVGASEWATRCPFHDDRRPSLFINAQKEVYHCFGCGAKGTLRQLWERLRG